MPEESLVCPNCGAPLDDQNFDGPTLRCPFCQTPVVVPEAIQKEKAAAAMLAMAKSGRFPRANTGVNLWIALALCLVLLGSGIVVFATLRSTPPAPSPSSYISESRMETQVAGLAPYLAPIENP